MGTGFEEKSAWVQFGALAIVLGNYFVTAARMLNAGITEIVAYVPVFTLSVIMLVVVLVVGHIVVAANGKTEQADERDRLIAWRSEYLSSWIVGAGAISAVFAMVFKVEVVLVAHLLLLSLLLSELLCIGLRIYFYRRGI